MKRFIATLCIYEMMIFSWGLINSTPASAPVEEQVIQTRMTVEEPEPVIETEPSISMTSMEDMAVEVVPLETSVEASEIIVSEDKEYAFKVWCMLDEAGCNDYVKAGILGNMMIETGGGTLALQPEIYSSNGYYYGLCQWNADAFSDVHGTDLETQVQYLLDTMGQIFDGYGYGYENFLNIENEQRAALVFAIYYEGCHESTYDIRQSCASVAYNYFTELYNN